MVNIQSFVFKQGAESIVQENSTQILRIHFVMFAVFFGNECGFSIGECSPAMRFNLFVVLSC
jgi:hypothetical protein